jgi:hypothetical protein
MRIVAGETIFRNVRMFIEKWTSFFSMAFDTCFLDIVMEQVAVSESSMGVMAVNTEHPSFVEGVVAWQRKLGLGRLMAVETKLASGKGGYF